MVHNTYEIVSGGEDEDESFSWKYCLRQIFVCSALCVLYFAVGMGFGSATVFIPQMRKEGNPAFEVSESLGSWIMSTMAFSAIPMCLVFPAIAAFFGRKIPHILVSICFVIGCFIFHFSTNITHVMIFEISAGFVVATMTTICSMVLTEYTSPRYRGTVSAFLLATSFWGLTVSNAIGTFCHWKYISLVLLILSFYPLVTILFWPESPYYLAGKGRFDECIKAHKWLKGNGKTANKELERLLKQKEPKKDFKSILKLVCSRSFYKPTFICCCVILLYTFSGKFVCTAYSIDIIKQMTSSESTAYTGMLILDGVSVLSMYVGTAMSLFINRRTLLFSTSALGVASLFVLSLYTYLVSLEVIADNKFVTISLLSFFSIVVCSGPMILSTPLYYELLPTNCRVICMCTVAMIEKIIIGIVTKTSPYIIAKLGLHTAFFSFGLSTSILIIFLYFYMPEKKDKTLHEITDMILSNGTKDKEGKALCDNDI